MSTLIKIKHGNTEPGQTDGNEVGEPLWQTNINTLYVRDTGGVPRAVVRAEDGCEIITSAPTEVIAGYQGSVRPSLVDYSPIGTIGSNSIQISSTNTPVSLNSIKKLKLKERSPYSENAWSEIVEAVRRKDNTNLFDLKLSNEERIVIDLSLSIGNSRIKLVAANKVLFWRPSAEGRSFTVNDLSIFSGKIADFSTVDAVIIDVTDVCQSDHTLLVDNKGYIKIGPVAFVKKPEGTEGNIYYESAAVKSYSNIHGDSASVRAGSSITKSWSSDSDDKIDQCGSIAYNLKVRTGFNPDGPEELRKPIFGYPYTNCPYPGTLMITVTENLGRMYSLASTTGDEGDEGTGI